MKANFESMRDLTLEQRNQALVAWLNDLTTVYEKCAAERDALRSVIEHALTAHRSGELAHNVLEALFIEYQMRCRREEWPAQRLDDAARSTEEP